MADDWQPGDLALCVNTEAVWRTDAAGNLYRATAGKRLRRGAVYRVTGIGMIVTRSGRRLLSPVLSLEGVDGNAGAWRFRKIRPHTPDAEDRETIALLNGAPVKEPAA